MTNNNFISIFNLIFNKIPHIYSEIFLKIFTNNYYYFSNCSKSDDLNVFINIMNTMFNNVNKLYNKDFYYYSINSYLTKCKTPNNIYTVSSILASPIEDKYLLEIIDNNPKIPNMYNNLSKLYTYHLISKTLIKIFMLLIYYNNLEDLYFKNHINMTVEKYRTLELNMDHILESYKEEFKHIISKTNYKILIYILSLAKNGQEIEKKYHNKISKIIDSIGYSNSLHKIINYKRFNYPPKPYIHKNISILLIILFQKNYNNYNFICNKEKILKTCFYLYIKNLSLPDKIIISISFPLWSYEWNSIKKHYEY